MNNAHLRFAVLAATRAGLYPAFSALGESPSYPGERLLRALQLENAIVPGKPTRTASVSSFTTSAPLHPGTMPRINCHPSLRLWSGRGQPSRGLREAKPQGGVTGRARRPRRARRGRPGAHRATGRPVSCPSQNGGSILSHQPGRARRCLVAPGADLAAAVHVDGVREGGGRAAAGVAQVMVSAELVRFMACLPA